MCNNMTYLIPDPLIPPLKFNSIQSNLYRGAYPREINYPFLLTLKLKTIISLTPEPITEETDSQLFEFAHNNGINLVHLECTKSGKGKKRGVPLEYGVIVEALQYFIHSENSPIYIHCFNGGQVTSLVVACLRKLQFWSSITIFNEFINFTSNITVNDRSFVEGFKADIHVNQETKVDWLWMGMSRGVVGNHPNIRVIEQQKAERIL
ncbi:putative tyrosine-protein phosphatase Oca6p [[Candida] railenensis]|uniref:Tyrosine-protein phosphatase Oca6p n=1 Tax=[Candida] railenensis TaxID=45579 RepID=A0A9P0QLR5_9ASCO|nr:putative tyrosine-protein phosphatase Oca6p [[Candida] railenensis]